MRGGSVGTLFLSLLVLLIALIAACAGAPRAAPGVASELPLWQVAAADLHSQRLFRVSYSGPEGTGSFKVTLRLASLERYQIQAADPLGRPLWSLDVGAGRGLWLDHRNHVYCTFSGRFDLSGLPLGPFPLLSLPALLLGRVPAEPRDTAALGHEGGGISFRDASLRRWTASPASGEVASWRLWEGDQPAVWWMRRDGWAILSDRSRGVQVRWREVLHEALLGEPAALTAPAGYRA
ncbi:MAG: hypothetical protein M3O15_13795, partial [Acidobacteriota bacterium]|nr:hypothetical protein [Acidobacteriota bacterium]